MTARQVELLKQLIQRYQHRQQLLIEWCDGNKISGSYPSQGEAWVEIAPDGGRIGQGQRKTAQTLVNAGLAEWEGEGNHLVLANLTTED